MRPSVAVGSPADDTGVTRLNLNDILVSHAQAKYAWPCEPPLSQASGENRRSLTVPNARNLMQCVSLPIEQAT